MLRITQSDRAATSRDFTLEGELSGPWVDELERVTFGAGSVDGICLDLRNLSFADMTGVALLRRLRAGGVELGGCSAYLSLLIGEDDGAR